ncbi:putative TPX2 central domain-containing protein [Helianthus annuus]|nr:putative TPX2 central domain-containing protein [Helianthus annuus]KAJ0633157.1 putative TPX2 central domain-containing protein [Helianthus annuus]KAJ0827204.1 putative TPX2 central domain-containing protein [Helianthus annuus]
MTEDSVDVIIDPDYEFRAPKFYDFVKGETDDQIRETQLWFDTALAYAPSPIMHKIKTTRAFQLDTVCNFPETSEKEPVPSESTSSSHTLKKVDLEPEKHSANTERYPAEDATSNDEDVESVSNQLCVVEKPTELTKDLPSSNLTVEQTKTQITTYPSQGEEACTPKASQKNKNMLQTESKKQQTARRIASALKNPSTLESKNQTQAKCTKTPSTVRRDTNRTNKVCGTLNFAQENQAVKRQKLEEGKTRQILNIETQILPHKTSPGVVSNSNLAIPSTRSRTEERKMYIRDHAPVPFVSTAEMMRKFQTGTRDLNLPPRPSSLSHDDPPSQVMQRKTKLTLTRPKDPAFETSQRVRSVKLKSSAELEEEMMAKIPKFKARPLNKKILKAPTLPAMKRSTPQLPEFHEFHLETTERANQNAETSTVASTETAAASRVHQWKPHLTTPKTPPLQTLLRARPVKIKSTEELEKEELENAPKFKARPLNKMIFESKGEMGLFCNRKRQVTTPQEFRFATDERIPPASSNVADLFHKLSVHSVSHNQKQVTRNTAPNPFHLQTEERGAKKVKRFVTEVMHKQIEEEQAIIPKATPYQFTTDYPVVPPKPQPKQCTKPEPFRLESVARHEEEVRKDMEERKRLKEEEARMRMFKAQPILKEDPVPLPEKVRRPLTEVQEFDLHAQHRAVYRAEFDKKVKEKEMMYKRYRDEEESAKMMEEEKALKQLRRTLVPHARPVPNFSKPFLPQKSSKGVTKPKSPRLKIAERTERRKMVVAAASNMR